MEASLMPSTASNTRILGSVQQPTQETSVENYGKVFEDASCVQHTDVARSKENEDETEEEPASQDEKDATMNGMPLIMLTVGMMGIVFLMCLDHYILATAIPRITTDFNALQDAAWYSSGYFLTNMALQPAFGQLYKLFSIKLIFLACLLIFEAGSILCALAPSSIALILGRIVTGIGGGGLYIGCVVLIGYVVPLKRRAAYISMVTSLDGAASVAGPLLGGVFTDSSLTWRFCFWINLPIGFVAFVVLWWYLRDPPQHTAVAGSVFQRLLAVDWLSLTLLLGGFSMLLLALQWAGIVYSWSDPHIYGMLVGASLALILYFLYQAHQGDKAAIPYRILRQRTVFFSAAFMLLMNMFIGALVYYLPFQFQAVRGDSAKKSGVVNLAFLVPLLAFMYLGSIVATIGAGLLTTLSGATPQANLIAYQFLAGFGGGLCHQIPYTSILHVLPASDMVPGSALCSFLNSLGSILGIIVAQVIFASLLARNLQGLVGVDAQTVIQAGPTNISNVVSGVIADKVRTAYNGALRDTYVLPVVAAGLCCFCAVGMEWKRIKN